MLRKIRLTFAMICFVLITLLFLDFTGTLHGWFGWLAKIQFLPAVLALNVGVILFLVILTLVCGRIYCSVICPLGVFQDILAWLGRQPKKRRKLPYSYSPALSWLRYGVLGVFIIALMVLGGFKTVYADIISTPALALLCEAGIETTFAQEVPHIINRDKTGWCPLETACMELNTVEEMYPVIQNFISRIRAK